MSTLLAQLGEIKVIPVVAIENADDAPRLAEALLEGNLPCAEITFRTAAAQESIAKMSVFENMLVGAGTVITIDQVKAAVDAGAKFIVSPGFDPKVCEYCVENNIPITPGAVTATEIQAAISVGLSVVKFFPAEAIGGLKLLKSLAAPFGQIQFIPTGGINSDNIGDYLAHPQVLACGGSWMVNKALINNGDFGEITKLSQAAVDAVKS